MTGILEVGVIMGPLMGLRLSFIWASIRSVYEWRNGEYSKGFKRIQTDSRDLMSHECAWKHWETLGSPSPLKPRLRPPRD
jgi:hypothetical protein